MERRVLRPSKLRSGLYALGGAVLAAGLLTLDEWWAYGAAAFFGLGTLVMTARVAGGSSLELSPAGLRIREGFRTQGVLRWDDVEAFPVVEQGGGEFVGVELRNAALDAFVEGLIGPGPTGMLPDTYGMEAAEVAELLENWRLRHARTREPAEPLRALPGEPLEDVLSRPPGNAS